MQINSSEANKSRKVESIDVDADITDLDNGSNIKNDLIATLQSSDSIK